MSTLSFQWYRGYNIRLYHLFLVDAKLGGGSVNESIEARYNRAIVFVIQNTINENLALFQLDRMAKKVAALKNSVCNQFPSWILNQKSPHFLNY